MQRINVKLKLKFAVVISEIIGRSGRHFLARFLWWHNEQAVRGLWLQPLLFSNKLPWLLQHVVKQTSLVDKTFWNSMQKIKFHSLFMQWNEMGVRWKLYVHITLNNGQIMLNNFRQTFYVTFAYTIAIPSFVYDFGAPYSERWTFRQHFCTV